MNKGIPVVTPGASFFTCETLIIQLISEPPASLLDIIFLVFRSPSDCKMPNLKHLSFPAPAAKIPNASECKMSKPIKAINLMWKWFLKSLFMRVCFLLQGPPHLLITNFNNFSIKSVIKACLFQWSHVSTTPYLCARILFTSQDPTMSHFCTLIKVWLCFFFSWRKL